jgi:hypothetical protein
VILLKRNVLTSLQFLGRVNAALAEKPLFELSINSKRAAHFPQITNEELDEIL